MVRLTQIIQLGPIWLNEFFKAENVSLLWSEKDMRMEAKWDIWYVADLKIERGAPCVKECRKVAKNWKVAKNYL